LRNDGTVDTAKNTGNIAKQIVSYQGLAQAYVQSFKYDALDRIIEAKENNGTVNGTQNWQQTYNYDRFGNRTQFSQIVGNTTLAINNETLPSVNATTNRFNQNQNYIYDKNGNIVQDIVNGQVRNFVFDSDNKQTDVKNASNQLIGKYFYDGEGKRVKKVTQSETTVFVYSSGKLVAEYSTATPPENKQIRYFGTDQLVTPRVITNQNGQVISRRDYMPFGEEININRSNADKYGVLDDGVRQGFTNYEKDRETNLDFAEARMYNSNHGRFTAVDPLLASGKSANPQTFNRYVYVMNRPLVLSDPSGMQAASNPSLDICKVGTAGCSTDGLGVILNVPVPISFGNTSPVQTFGLLGDTINFRPLIPTIVQGTATVTGAGAGAIAGPGAAVVGGCLIGALFCQRLGLGPTAGNFGNIPFTYGGQRAISNTGGISFFPRTSYNFRDTTGLTTATIGTTTTTTEEASPTPTPSPYGTPRPNPFRPTPTPTPRRYNLALGLMPYVFKLIDQNTKTYQQAAGTPVWTYNDFVRVANGSQMIRFTLEGFDTTRYNNWLKNDGNYRFPSVNNITNAEYYIVKNNPTLWNKTIVGDLPPTGLP
jgi:RHS repeat-associated protein